MKRIPSPPKFSFNFSLTYTAQDKDKLSGLESRSGQVFRWMKELSLLLKGRPDILDGVVMTGPIDGFTTYYDLYCEGGVITTFVGWDYGHSWFVEVGSNSKERAEEMEAAIMQVFGANNILGKTKELQGLRCYYYC